MYKNKRASAIIAGAGASVRMGGGISKQLLKIGDNTVIEHTVQRFEQCEYIDEIIIVCPPDQESVFQEMFPNHTVTQGGKTRQESVYNGVCATSNECSLIVIHDGARPLVTVNEICSVIEDAEKYGSSTLAVPVKDTIKAVENGIVIDTPPRERLFAVQTPQVFYKEQYIQAYKTALQNKHDFTDDCQLIESIGEKVHITIGNYENIKITTPEDITIARALLHLY
ncbi:MAG: 2-C-methyl-D-erythritol 4-phosphate cytidylyltransferase [Acutalibacteraceae bacterium]|nr:2-C-methyl-D-erythritol 4-phosphate cytidylyltransferase [Acutalibacteraceae bacterium]